MTREHALALRALIEKSSASLGDSDALAGVELFPAWKVGVEYQPQVRVRYNGKLYRCEQFHVSQADWTPDIAPALWTEVAEPGTIPVWKQPTGAQDAYQKGDRVWYPERGMDIYVSTVGNNVWQPGVYGWEQVTA